MEYIRFRANRWIIILLASTLSLLSYAGGPLQVYQGKAIIWSPSDFPIVYNVDQGSLGPYDSAEGSDLIKTAFQKWQDVEDASISFQRGMDLPEDVNQVNAFRYLDGNRSDLNPIVFDDNGQIIRSLFGAGSESEILGFGGPVVTMENKIVAAQAVFNGLLIEQANLSKNAVLSTILHEFGHFMGLDHSQLFRHLAYDGVGWNDRFVPIMLPTASDDDSFRTEITAEDAYSLSRLYPIDTIEQTTGKIRGTLRRENRELPGVNVLARPINAVTPTAFTTVTGTDPSSPGSFEFSGLHPGEYLVWIEPIDPSFYDISSVGQYASSLSDKSFINPPPMQAYSANPANTSRSQWTSIFVSLNETPTDITFNTLSSPADPDETDAVLLLYDTSEIGALAGKQSSLFQYVFVPTGSESRIEINITADEASSDFDVFINQGERVSLNQTALRQSHDGKASIILGEDGDVPVTNDRYFIALQNRGTSDISFSIQATEIIIPIPTETPTETPIETPTETPPATPTPTFTPVPTPTAIEINPSLGLVVYDEMGGTFPLGMAVHNFDMGISGSMGTIMDDTQYDGLPDPDALGPFLFIKNQFYPVAKDMEFTGERNPGGNGSEGIYFLVGGMVGNLPPVMAKLGAVGGPNRGGIDTNNDPTDNIQHSNFSGDNIPVKRIITDTGIQFIDSLVDIEPAGNQGFYVLDKKGRIYAEGDALESIDQSSPPSQMKQDSIPVDLEIYRSRKISLSNSRYSQDLIGTGAYILCQDGTIYSLGEAPSLHTSDIPLLTDDSMAYRDIEFIPNPQGTEWIGLGVLRGDGFIYLAPFEDQPISSDLATYFQSLNPFGQLNQGFGFDIARDFEVEISETPLYGLNEQGETVATSDRRVGIFMVDGFGGIYTGGRSTRFLPAYGIAGDDIRMIEGVTTIPIPASIPFFGVNIIKDMELSPLVDRSIRSTQSFQSYGYASP